MWSDLQPENGKRVLARTTTESARHREAVEAAAADAVDAVGTVVQVLPAVLAAVGTMRTVTDEVATAVAVFTFKCVLYAVAVSLFVTL